MGIKYYSRYISVQSTCKYECNIRVVSLPKEETYDLNIQFQNVLKMKSVSYPQFTRNKTLAAQLKNIICK